MPVLSGILAVIAFIAATPFAAQKREGWTITCLAVGFFFFLAIFVPVNVIAIWTVGLLLAGLTIGAFAADTLGIALVLCGIDIYVLVKAYQMTAILF